MFPYKKINIVGPCASGKSYLSSKLGNLLDIPVYHMDKIYWLPNWEGLSLGELREKVIDISKKDKWIIDGTYSKVLEERVKDSDLLIFLDFDIDFCLKSLEKRHGQKRSDFPDFLDEEDPTELQNYIRGFKTGCRVRILECINKHKDLKVITFYTREEVNEFIDKLTRGEF